MTETQNSTAPVKALLFGLDLGEYDMEKSMEELAALAEAAEGHTLEGAAFDGVALTGLTPDVLTQHVEGCRQAENGAYELAGRDYTVRAGYENGQLVLLDMSRNYAVNG